MHSKHTKSCRGWFLDLVSSIFKPHVEGGKVISILKCSGPQING
jgi:hypothetical protein